MSSNTSSRMLTLLTQDGQTCTVHEDDIVLQSELIKGLLLDVDDSHDATIPVSNVDAKTLNLVLEWCGMHAKSKNEDEMKGWDAEFLDKDQEGLYHLFMAANYLEMHDLLEKIAKKVASMVTGKSAEEIREILQIENDYTHEEEAAVRAEHSWAFNPISVEQFEEEQRLLAEAREKAAAAAAAANEEDNAKKEVKEVTSKVENLRSANNTSLK